MSIAKVSNWSCPNMRPTNPYPPVPCYFDRCQYAVWACSEFWPDSYRVNNTMSVSHHSCCLVRILALWHVHGSAANASHIASHWYRHCWYALYDLFMSDAPFCDLISLCDNCFMTATTVSFWSNRKILSIQCHTHHSDSHMLAGTLNILCSHSDEHPVT